MTQFRERTFDLLADVAVLHKVVDVVSHGWKPEMRRNGVEHSSSTWMMKCVMEPLEGRFDKDGR